MAKSKNLLSISDLSPIDIRKILKKTAKIKKDIKQNKLKPQLNGKILGLLFEKPSLRTRVTFEVSMFKLGGYTIYLAPGDIQIGVREKVEDVGKTLSYFLDVMAVRTFSHQTVETLAQSSCIPVINALSDLEHPCQALSDIFTLTEYFSDLRDVRLTYVGDGNNTCHSLLLISANLGLNLSIATPKGYEPKKEFVQKAKEITKKTKGVCKITNDIMSAVKGANVIYTDVWTSMGQEKEKDVRKKIFSPYQINKKIYNLAAKDCLLMHCLPAHREEEITSEIMDSENSIIFPQAENRLYTTSAILTWIFDK